MCIPWILVKLGENSSRLKVKDHKCVCRKRQAGLQRSGNQYFCRHCRGEQRKKSNQDEKDWSASQSPTISQPPVRAALCSLPLSFRSQRFLAGSDSRNARLLCALLCWCAGVYAPGPLLLLLLLATQLRLEWAGLHCTALLCNAMHWLIVVPPTP